MNHGRLLTKERTAKWGSSSDRCPFCPDKVETILHAFRDCPKASSIWNLDLLHPLPPNFFVCSLFQVWLQINLHYLVGPRKDWRNSFFVVCNFLWSWRNSEIHDADFSRPENPKQCIYDYLDQISSSRPLSSNSSISPLTLPSLSYWTCPAPDMLKLNVDGAVLNGKAACGGILRDSFGAWRGGFNCFLGSCSPLLSEFWAVLHGLSFAWNEGWRNLSLESDSLQVISLLTSSGNDTRKLPLLAKIRVLLQRDWTVLLSHVPRDCNKCADWLAKEAFSNSFGLFSVPAPPPALQRLITADCLDPGDAHPLPSA